MSEQPPWPILILTTLLIHWRGIAHISWRFASVCSIRSGNRLTDYHFKPRHATKYLVAVHGSRWTTETVGFGESYQICGNAAAYQMRVNFLKPLLLSAASSSCKRMTCSTNGFFKQPGWRMWR
jgi:hypothetical protein